MKYFGWVFAFFSLMLNVIFITYSYDLQRIVARQKIFMSQVKMENLQLKAKQDNLDWLESKLTEIDEYISWKDRIIIKGAEDIPAKVRTEDELNKERLEVIKKAVTYNDKYK